MTIKHAWTYMSQGVTYFLSTCLHRVPLLPLGVPCTCGATLALVVKFVGAHGSLLANILVTVSGYPGLGLHLP
jgi:hypothetical protein